MNVTENQTDNDDLPRPGVAKKYLILAVILGVVSPMLVVFFYTSAGRLTFFLFFLVMLFSAIYLFHIFKITLIRRFGFTQIRLPINSFFGSLEAYMGLVLSSMLLLNHHPLDIALANAALVEKILYYVTILASFSISTSLILISFELENLAYNLYGLLKPLRYALLSLSLLLLIETLAIVGVYLANVPLLGALCMLALIVSELLLLLSYGLNCVFLSLILLFLTFREPAQPVQAA